MRKNATAGRKPLATRIIPTKPVFSEDPIVEFNSKFKYGWLFEKSNPPVTAEHYCITWTIENLGLVLFEEHKPLSSPTFLLDSSKTEWFIEVDPSGLCDEARDVGMYLYRCDDAGPEVVSLTFRFGVLLDEDMVVWSKEKKVKRFNRKAFSFLPVGESERAKLAENMFGCCDVFQIKCEMYATFPDSHPDERLLTPGDYDLMNLSFDISKLVMAIEISDYRIKLPLLNVRVNTHKAILAARSATFREILKDKDYSEEVQFCDITFDNLRRVLHFMYSGNFSMVLRGDPPSIGLYECAEKLAVTDLVALLSPKYLHLRSVLKSQEISYIWNIPHFAKSPTFSKSPPFGFPSENSPRWHMFVDFDRFSDQLGIFVETTQETKSLRSSLKISVFDGNGELINTMLTTEFKKPKEKFGFPGFLKEFTKKNTIYNLLIHDTLRVHCEILFVVSSDYLESYEKISERSNFLDAIKTLSGNLKQLFETSAFSDVVVKTTDNSMFEVHRSILFARSRKFYSKFLYYNKYDRMLDAYDVEPDSVRSMLEHAYSGVLKQMSVDDMLSLHNAADLYVFRSLSLVTQQRLAANIDAGNVFKLLMESDDLKDEYLEEKCMIYVRENAKTLVATADWDAFRREDDGLCQFLISVLKKEMKKQ